MSAGDFQTKYASVMESMLKSAVAETTKLFETMVDELKAEISRIKKENEDLKTRCLQFENSKSQPTVYTSEPLSGLSDGCEKRDTAIQCDLVTLSTMLLEKRHTLRDTSLPQQEQLCRNVADYSFQEHNYVTPTEASSQMTLMHVKQEEYYNDSSPLSDLKKEKAESPVACGQILHEKPEISPPQKDEDTHMALETPCLEMYSGLQGFLNQSPSLVISLAAIKDMDEESEVGLKISEVGTQAKLLPYDNYPLVAAQHQSKVESLENRQLSEVPQKCETLVSEQINVPLQRYTHVHGTDEQGAEHTPTGSKVAHEKLKIGMAENVPSSHQVCRKRGRPPKRAKQLQSPNESPAKPKKASSVIAPLVQETVNIVLKFGEKRKVDSLPESIESSSVECLSVKKKTFESPKKAIEAPFCKVLSEPATLNTPPAESAQASSVQPKERHTSVPLQDAMLLVEAMNQSTVENATPHQAKCAPHVQSLQNVEENPTEQHTPIYLANEVAGKLPAAEPSTLTQSIVKTLCAAPQTTDATSPSEAQMHITAVIPNKEHVVTPSITTSSLQLPSSAPGIQTSVESYPQHQPHSLMTMGAQSNTVQSKMFLMPGSVSSLSQKVAVLSPSHLSSVLSTVLATQSASLTPGSTIRSLPLGVHSFISVPQKTVYVVSKSSTTLANQLSGTLPQRKVTVKISRPAPTVSGTHHSQPITANQESAAAATTTTAPAAAAATTTTTAATAAAATTTTAAAATTTAAAAATTTAAAAAAAATTTAAAAAAAATTTAAAAAATTTTTAAAAATTTTTAAAAATTTTTAAAPAATTTTAAAATTTAAAATTTTAAAATTTTAAAATTTAAAATTTTAAAAAAATATAATTPAVMSSHKLSSSSLKLNVCADAHIVSDEMTVVSPQKRESPSHKLESPKQASSASETTNAPTETCLGLKTLVLEPPVSALPVVQLAVNQKCSVVVKLTRLPFPMSTNESVLVSKFLSNGSPLSTDTCLSANTSMSEEPNVIQEKASASSDTCISLKELPNRSYMQSSISSKESATVFEKSAVAISTTKPSGDEHALDLDEKVISSSNCSRSNEPTAEEKQSAAPLQLTSVTCQAISDARLQLTKTQFLAQLAVSPIDEAQKKASDDTDARASYAKTRSSRKKNLQKNSLGAQPQSHSKPPVQTRTETNLEPCREIENTIAKGIGLENDSANDKNTIGEPGLVSSKKTGMVEEVPSVIKTNKDPTLTNPVRSGQYNDVRSMRIVGEASLTPRKLKAFIESTLVSPRGSSSSRDGEGCKNKKSNSVSPKGSTSCNDGASSLKKSTFLSPQTVSSNRHGASDKKTKSASVSPKRTCSTRYGDSPRKTKSTSMSPNRSRSSTEAASPKRTNSTSFSPRRKNAASPKVSTNKSVPDSHRWSTLTKVSPSIKQSEKDSNSFNSRRYSVVTHSVSTKISKSEAGFPSARWPKLPTDSVSSKRAGESTPAKKPRLVQASTSPKKNVRVVEAKKLPKGVKGETVTKIRVSVNQANGEAMKNIRTQAVWTPPRMPASKTSSAGGKSSSPLETKKESRSPRSVVYPPSVFLHPIPVKAAPIVSPLQPLLVIGKHLLKNQCGACGRVLSSIAALESHVSLHTGNRPFSCSLCGKTFPDSKSFKRHDRVHRNGRIHVCKHCGKGFVYRFGLSKHLRMVHSRIRPFVCQICNKGFFTKRDVEAHIRIHTGEKPFHCNLCEKKFASRVKLNVHFRWHNGEKRHWCPYCGKGFLDFNNLKRHKYIHTGEKPYSCPYCSKHFSQSGHVKKHVTNVHKIESD